MRCRLTIIGLLLLAGIAVVLVCPEASGGADPGIKHEHLDPDAGDFADDVTIEIDVTNGLQVKAIPAASVSPAKIDSIFGAWTDDDSELNTLAKNNVYMATSDGFVTVYGDGSLATLTIYTDGSNPPTTVRASIGRPYGNNENGMIPVRKNDYWKITYSGTPTIHWLPIGSGSCVKQP
ncbi:MAG: hypothetical protein JW720_10760 [Sedimentisphaerales bacterium]|nr:hypothetical protein [Sedimentisphaerales bacterium]